LVVAFNNGKEDGMKPVSKILIVVAVVIVIVAVGLYFVVSNIDAIVKSGIEKYGSKATGTKVSVSSVKIHLRAGEGSIGGLSIRNPAGFSAPDAFTLADISIAIDTSSLTKNPVVIDSIRVSAPRVTYEVDASGKANINEIRSNLRRYASGKPSGEEKAGAAKKILIRSLVIEGGKVDIHVAALPGKDLSASIPKVQLTDVGGKGGSTPGDLATQVLTPLVDRAVRAAAGEGVERYLGKSAEEVQKAIEEKAREKLGGGGEEAAGEAVRKLLGK
jgi:hypothetical protein